MKLDFFVLTSLTTTITITATSTTITATINTITTTTTPQLPTRVFSHPETKKMTLIGCVTLHPNLYNFTT